MPKSTFPKNTPNKGAGNQVGRPGMAHNGIGPAKAPGAKDKIDKYKGSYKSPTTRAGRNNGVGPAIMK